MTRSLILSIALAAGIAASTLPAAAAFAAPAPAPAADSGVIRLKSANGVDETLKRLKADIAGKGSSSSRRPISPTSARSPASPCIVRF